MNTKDLFFKYGITLNRRFKRQEKTVFCNAIGHDFQDCGYEVKAQVQKNGRNKVIMNLKAGNVEKSQCVITANYDTPVHNFAKPFNYYPLNGVTSYHAARIPYFTPMIMVIVISLYLLLAVVPKIDFSAHPVLAILFIILFAAMTVLGTLCSSSIGNKVNMNRNTSGCVAALAIAQQLDKSKANVSFVLTDYGCTQLLGNAMLREELDKTNHKHQIILLDCLGKGDTTMVGYQEGHKKEAEELAAYLHAKIALVDAESAKYSGYSYYREGLIVTRGFLNKDSGAISIPDTATNKDDTVDTNTIDEIIQNLTAYLEDNYA